jgi:hypothetical protein
LVDEIGFHGLELSTVRGDGPGVEVIEFFVDVVADGTVGIVAALRLEDANGLALAFDGVVLAIDGNQVFVEEYDGGGIFGAGGGGHVGGVYGPLRGGLVLIPCRRGGWAKQYIGAGNHNGKNRKTIATHEHQFPFAAGDAERTSCC